MKANLYSSDYKNIFGEEITPKAKHAKAKKNGYAFAPNTGPAGETCGSCKHLYRRQCSKAFFKCQKFRDMGGKWTGGYGTDILVKSPACKFWEKSE